MKKLISLLLTVAMLATCLVGCGGGNADGGNANDGNAGNDGGNAAAGYEIALVTDKGNIDDKSFNQGAWEGVVAYAEANNITHQYYKPEEASDEGYLAAIQLAVDGGAKVVVCPGYLFEAAVYSAQTMFPEVKFILLDGEPHTPDYATYKTETNVACVMYAEEEAGYLAGYAAVMDGMRTLGFEGGMAVPAVVAFGYGYLQGIEAAAAELGLEDGSVKVFYHYTGDFAETDANKAVAKGMIQSGAELIFGCGGSVGKSVFAAAAEDGIKTIGVDVNQKADSETVITSAMKGLGASVQAVLTSIYDGSFDGTYAGKTTYFTAANNGVGLPDDYERFTSFTKEQYDAVFAKLVDGTVDPIRAFDIADAAAVTAEQLQTELGLVKVVVEKR
ncbi:MAG: BMP family ABC transporter substrate-binding protein [Agathobacter sp.]|nr:BMP family ABC transporter substrate-binding protein [Agathobacter sp.]